MRKPTISLSASLTVMTKACGAWFERRYPKATKRAAKGRNWREFVTAIREFYGEGTRLQ